MAKRPNILLEHTDNVSLLSALSILIVICLLPLILVKVFQHQQTKQSTTESLELPPPASTSLSSSLILKTINKQLERHTNTPNTPQTKTANTSPPQPHVQPPTSSEQIVIALKGDTLGKIFKRLGLSAKNLQEIIKNKPQSKILTRIKPGQRLTFIINNYRIEKLVFPFSLAEDLVIVEVAHQYQGSVAQKNTTPRYQSVSATIQGSLYNTAKRHNIPYGLIQQMSSIFNRDIDFKKGMRSGDRFSILYKANYIQNTQIGKSEVLAASYTTRGTTHEAIRYTNRDGSSNYYTPQGLSLKKAYDRYPIRFSHIASPFTLSRYHPILHYRRPHYGIDLAAPMGTPIHAIGDGRIEIIDRQGGYGNMIKIHHNSMYSTIYGHLLRFEKGLYRGKFVQRGQVIGYVGQSGLASGPHCHFEFHIHEQPKNPTTISLPHADPIPRREMTTFKQRVHQLLAALHTRHSPKLPEQSNQKQQV
jgi:murein DD-endopeptidase MepM/ murein hydrolase activator NlpD